MLFEVHFSSLFKLATKAIAKNRIVLKHINFNLDKSSFIKEFKNILTFLFGIHLTIHYIYFYTIGFF
ncbi:hypothetical protein VCR4J2_510043 [Vibrio coralliirubri]|nr:hypothetical protein VCR4J2_510043 [Vibrio coralliirubri]